MTNRKKATDLHRKAIALQEKGRLEEAIALFRQAAALVPGWAAPLYNLGLLFKQAHRWEESLEYNQRATQADPTNEAAWWNLGIAATALGRWPVARVAWRGFGIDLPAGDGPVELPCGFGPIRLNPDGDAEVVWAQRVDPARAMLASIPFPESGHRWKDIVLNDGQPSGYRKHQGKDIPVLNALELLEPSVFGTYVARVSMPAEPLYVSQLTEIAAERDGSAEDWSTSTLLLCKACSEGRPHQTHDTQAAPPDGAHLIGVAARDRTHATEILSAWEVGREGIEVESLDDALEAGHPANGG